MMSILMQATLGTPGAESLYVRLETLVCDTGPKTQGVRKNLYPTWPALCADGSGGPSYRLIAGSLCAGVLIAAVKSIGLRNRSWETYNRRLSRNALDKCTVLI